MSARIKILTVIYILILVGIIILADIRQSQFLFRPVRSLPYGDKISHFLLMGFLSFMVNLGLNAKTFQLFKMRYLLGSIIVLLVVTAEEFSQIFIRGRSFDLGDLAADFLGIVIFGEIARVVCGRFLGKDLSGKKA